MHNKHIKNRPQKTWAGLATARLLRGPLASKEVMSKRPKIGDIVEIPLSENGTGYAQYTHKHKQYGALLRVFQVREKVDDLAELLNVPHQFTTFFPLGAAVNREVVSIAGNLPVQEKFKTFPTLFA